MGARGLLSTVCLVALLSGCGSDGSDDAKDSGESARAQEIDAPKTLDDLIKAIKANDAAKVRVGLKAHPEWLTAKGPRKKPLIHIAVWEQRQAALKALLDAGADPNAFSPGKNTALHIVAHFGNRAITRMLLESGADVNARDKSEETPLHRLRPLTMSPHYGAVARMLIAHGAEVNARAADGDTPLHHACNAEVAAALLAAGADPDAKGRRGRTPLVCTVRKRWRDYRDRAKVVQLLVDAGADVHVRTDGQSLVRWAAERSYYDTEQILRARGAKE